MTQTKQDDEVSTSNIINSIEEPGTIIKIGELHLCCSYKDLNVTELSKLALWILSQRLIMEYLEIVKRKKASNSYLG